MAHEGLGQRFISAKPSNPARTIDLRIFNESALGFSTITLDADTAINLANELITYCEAIERHRTEPHRPHRRMGPPTTHNVS